jgi:opacity protein-like surface antigen
MHRFLAGVMAASLSVLLAVPATAAPPKPWYASLKAGVFLPNNDSDGLDEFDPGVTIEGAFGFRPHRNFAAELGVAWYRAQSDDLDIDLDVVPVTLTAKGILPLLGDRLELFGGAGVGYYFASWDPDEGDEEDEGSFGYHLVAGADYKLTSSVAIGIEGKYFWAEPDVDSQDVQIGGGIITAGVKYLF